MAQIDSLTADAIIALVNAGTWPQKFALVQGTVNASGNTLFADTSVASNLLVHVKNIGSSADTAGVVIFEGSVDSTTGSDGTWFPLQATRSGDGTQETGRAAASLAAGVAQAYAWKISVAGAMWFRVRCTTNVSASSSMEWTIARSAKGSDPAVVNQSATAVTVSGTPNVAIPGGVVASGTVTANAGSGTFATEEVAGTKFQAQSTASDNATLVKSSAGSLLEFSIYNGSAAIVYLKFYDKTTIPLPASDGAVLMDIVPVPIGGRVTTEYGTAGKKFTAGIGFAIVANAAITDNTNVATGVTVSGTYY